MQQTPESDSQHQQQGMDGQAQDPNAYGGYTKPSGVSASAQPFIPGQQSYQQHHHHQQVMMMQHQQHHHHHQSMHHQQHMYGHHHHHHHQGMGMGGAPGSAFLGGAAALSGGPGGVGTVAKSSRVCRHYVRGRCTWGPQCRFTHDPAALAMEASKPDMYSKPPQMGTRSPMSGQQREGGNWLGMQQSQLQNQRHTILLAALQAKFMIRALPNGQNNSNNNSSSSSNNGSEQKGQVILTSLPSAPEIIINVLNEEAIGQALDRLESDERVREGGLLYLVGESSVFWSMMRLWHVKGSTGSTRWDEALEHANNAGAVECMFYRTAAGCLATRCAFEHVGAPGGQQQQGTDYHPSLQHMQGQAGNGEMMMHQGQEESAPNTADEDQQQQGQPQAAANNGQQQTEGGKSPSQQPEMEAVRGIW